MDNLSRIGNTSLVRLTSITAPGFNIYAKVESSNPGGSVKDRVALAMIKEAEKQGKIFPSCTLVEPTSGNTGIGLAMVAAAYNIKLILTMPETMSIERRKLMSAYGAEIVLTSGKDGMKGAIARAQKIVCETPGAFMADQFSNSANPAAHEETTGPEIIRDLKGIKVDAFIFVVGTGGTLTGVGRALRKEGINAPIVAVEPADSPVISGGKPGPHKIQGIGAGFVPLNLDTSLIGEIIKVENEEAFEWARKLAKQEGILAGISSGAALCACMKYRVLHSDKPLNLVTLFPDSGERYLSTELF